jgi:hypothetical protein
VEYRRFPRDIREELLMTEEQLKAIEQFAERIKKYYKNYRGTVASGMVVYFIEQVLKEYQNAGFQDNVR